MQKYEVEGYEPSFLPDGKKWKPVWSDEFDGERLDTDKWSFRLNYWGYPAEQYTDKGVSLDGNGCVVFRPVVENGMVKSSQLQTGANSFDNLDLYGKISSRIGETSSFDFRLGEKELLHRNLPGTFHKFSHSILTGDHASAPQCFCS